MMKMAKNWSFMLQHDTPTPTPRRRSARLIVELRLGGGRRRRSLRLGEPEPKFYEFSGPPRRRNASPRRSIALPRCTCSPVLVHLFR